MPRIDRPSRADRPSFVRAVVLIALSLGLWAGGLKLFTLHNDFPAAYHPDETSKAEQLIDGTRNFNHPQLMLEAALWVLPTPLPADADAVVRQSRVVSAAFAAGAAVLLAWAGYAAAGMAGFVCVGVTVGLCPALFTHAHYFKEDAALVFGIAATLCAGAWAMRVRSPGLLVWTTIALGTGVGLAASGKYCGVVMLLPAVVAAVAAALRRRQWALATAGPVVVVSVAACVWAGVNWRIFTDYRGFLDGFGHEAEHSVTGHRGITIATPNGYFVNEVWQEAMPHVPALAAVALALPAVAFVARRLRVLRVWFPLPRTRGGGLGRGPSVDNAPDALGPLPNPPPDCRERGLIRYGVAAWIAFAVAVYLAMLSYNTIPFYRYALPVTVMLHALAGLGAAAMAGLVPAGRRRFVTFETIAILVAALQGGRCIDYAHQFADDSRDAFRQWAWATLPAGTAVAIDDYALAYAPGVPGPGPLGQHLRVEHGMATSVDALRRDGVRYAVTVGSNSERYLSPYVIPERGVYGRVMAYYQDLLRYPVVYRRVADHPMRSFTNPDIVAYDITKPPR